MYRPALQVVKDVDVDDDESDPSLSSCSESCGSSSTDSLTTFFQDQIQNINKEKENADNGNDGKETPKRIPKLIKRKHRRNRSAAAANFRIPSGVMPPKFPRRCTQIGLGIDRNSSRSTAAKLGPLEEPKTESNLNAIIEERRKQAGKTPTTRSAIAESPKPPRQFDAENAARSPNSAENSPVNDAEDAARSPNAAENSTVNELSDTQLDGSSMGSTTEDSPRPPVRVRRLSGGLLITDADSTNANASDSKKRHKRRRSSLPGLGDMQAVVRRAVVDNRLQADFMHRTNVSSKLQRNERYRLMIAEKARKDLLRLQNNVRAQSRQKIATLVREKEARKAERKRRRREIRMQKRKEKADVLRRLRLVSVCTYFH